MGFFKLAKETVSWGDGKGWVWELGDREDSINYTEPDRYPRKFCTFQKEKS